LATTHYIAVIRLMKLRWLLIPKILSWLLLDLEVLEVWIFIIQISKWDLFKNVSVLCIIVVLHLTEGCK